MCSAQFLTERRISSPASLSRGQRSWERVSGCCIAS
uniref:Putative pheromone n=1 Tax=Flammulina velutipes TaxID=38945 RepID=A0A7T0NBA5_FLAVE|nr:putative pheromone precursor [Flammulina velutipes]